MVRVNSSVCTGCLKKKYRCLIAYIRKTRTVIALKYIVFYSGRANLNFDILQEDFDAKLCEI